MKRRSSKHSLIGVKIFKTRLVLGMTLPELAKKSGVSKGLLSRLETSKQNPTLGTLEKIAKALGVEVGDLV